MHAQVSHLMPLDEAARQALGITIPQAQKPDNDQRLLTAPVFANAPEPFGHLWRNLATLENQLAEQLLEQPDCALVIGVHAFFLHEGAEGIALMHAARYGDEFFDAQSRFDLDMGWVDVDTAEIEDYNLTLEQAIRDFGSLSRISVPAATGTEVGAEVTHPFPTSLERLTEQLQARGVSRFELSGITNAMYVGMVIAESGDHVAQDIGRGRVYVHVKDNLSVVPAVGQKPTITFKDGRGFVSGLDEPAAERGR